MKILLAPLAILLLIITGSFNNSESRLIKKAAHIHHEVLTVDSHADTPLNLRLPGYKFNEQHDSISRRSKIDLPGLNEGDLDGVFFAAFVGQGERDEAGNREALEEARAICDSIHTLIRQYPDDLMTATKSSDLALAASEGKHAIYIGMENGYPLGNNLDLIDTFYRQGVRYITLCHSSNNDICDSSTDTLELGGLSEFGREVVKRMNDLGIMVDISHASDRSFYDVIDLSRVPVIASHSCSRAICDNPRNLNDEMLTALKENGGVIQVCFVSEYLKTPEPDTRRDSAKAAVVARHGEFKDLKADAREAFIKDWYAVDREFPPDLATVSDLVDHIDHIVEVAGIDHVGIGSDFDGGGAVDGCFDVSEIGNITLELVKRGYSRKDIAKIWGGNLTRVMAEVEKQASRK